MSITIEKTGILTTIQDLGRNGFRKSGINPNGAIDRTSVRLINILLGNSESEAVLEMLFPAPLIKFNENAVFAIGGANFSPELNNKPIENWKIFYAKKNDILQFTNKLRGNFCYLSVLKGFKIEKWLGSASTNITAEIGGLEGRSLQKSDKIEFNSKSVSDDSQLQTKLGRKIISQFSDSVRVRFIAGPEFKELTAKCELTFLKENFSITNNSNRMGFRLKGKPLHLLSENEILSSAVDFGTIQLLPDNQLIILMADHQTTGGYPQIGNVIKPDLPLIAQAGTGGKIAFEQISITQAEEINARFQKDLSFLKIGVKINHNAKN